MKSHLKRLAMPKTWDIKRKKTVYILRPLPGGNNMANSMPLQLVLRDVLKVAKTAKEVRYVLQKKGVLVNGVARKEVKYPVGLMDVIEIPELKKAYRMLLNQKGKFMIQELDKKENDIVLMRIRNKTSVGKDKTQLNFSNGSNLLVKKDTYKTFDTISYDFKKKKIADHHVFGKNVMIYLIGGNHVGKVGSLQDIKDDNIIIKTKSGDIFETAKRYAFVVGKDKPVIEIKNE